MLSRKGHAYWLSITTNSYDEQQIKLQYVHNRNPDNNIEPTTSCVESRQKEHSAIIHTLKVWFLTSLLTVIDLSLSGSGPYTSTEQTDKNKHA